MDHAHLVAEPAHVAAHRQSLERAWRERRPKWSRTDTTRFLDDRGPALLAVLRQRARATPKSSHAMGRWLKDNQPKTYDRAHARLAACADDDERARLLPSDLV